MSEVLCWLAVFIIAGAFLVLGCLAFVSTRADKARRDYEDDFWNIP